MSTRERILEYASYQPGWNFSKGIPPTEKTIENALFFNDLFTFMGQHNTHAFLGDKGEIRLMVYIPAYYVEIDILEDDVTYSFTDDQIEYYLDSKIKVASKDVRG